MSADRASLEEAERSCQDLGRFLGERMPPGWGFCLVLGTMGDSGFMTYISSIQRPDAAAMMQELIERWKRKDPHV